MTKQTERANENKRPKLSHNHWPPSWDREGNKEYFTHIRINTLWQKLTRLYANNWKLGIADLEANDHGDSTLCKHLKTFQGSVHTALEICLGTIVIIRLFTFFVHIKTSIWYGLKYSTRIDLNTCFLRKVLCLQSFAEWQALLLLISIANRLLKETTQLQLIRNTSSSFIPT